MEQAKSKKKEPLDYKEFQKLLNMMRDYDEKVSIYNKRGGDHFGGPSGGASGFFGGGNLGM